jgi:hypothetical protein
LGRAHRANRRRSSFDTSGKFLSECRRRNGSEATSLVIEMSLSPTDAKLFRERLAFLRKESERYVKPILFKTVPCVNVEA